MTNKKEKKPRTSGRGAVPPAAGEGGKASAAGAAEERIAKRLARAGVASRRDAEAMIAEGRVKVNGRALTSPAFNVRDSDRIEVDGEPIPTVERTRLFLFHKPAGVVTTSRDPEGRKTIFDILPAGLPRLITVGRLDINTEGLLLLTNDGGLKRVLELPSTGWLRRYRVRVHGKVDPLALAELEKGIAVDGVFYGAITATMDRQQGSNAWLTLGLREGKNREVKNVLGALGLDVTRLIRISYGPFQLGELVEGAVQEIKGRTLRDQLGERLVEEAGANFDAPISLPFANKPVRAERPARPAPAGAPGKAAVRERGKDEERRPPPKRRKSREEIHEEMRGRLQTRAPARPGKDERAARPGKDERPARAGRDERPSRSGKDERPARAGKEERLARPGRDERPARTGRDERPARTGRDERPARNGKDEKPGRGQMERRSRSSNVWMAPGARPLGKKKAEEAAAAAERRSGAKGTGGDRSRRGDRDGKPSAPGPRRSNSERPRPDKGPKRR